MRYTNLFKRRKVGSREVIERQFLHLSGVVSFRCVDVAAVDQRMSSLTQNPSLMYS